MVIWIAAILLISAVALFVAAPLSEHAPGGISAATSTEAERREHEHALAVQALRELEFDYAMGKLDPGDYRALRQKLEIRALAAIGRWGKPPRQSTLDRVAPPVELPQSIAAVRAVTVKFCSQCGAKIEKAHNFCPNCGAHRGGTAVS